MDGIVLFLEWLACARPTRTHFLWKRTQVFFLLSTQHTRVRRSEALRPWPANQAVAVATDVIATFLFFHPCTTKYVAAFSVIPPPFFHIPQTWAPNRDTNNKVTTTAFGTSYVFFHQQRRWDERVDNRRDKMEEEKKKDECNMTRCPKMAVQPNPVLTRKSY